MYFHNANHAKQTAAQAGAEFVIHDSARRRYANLRNGLREVFGCEP